MFCLLSSLLCLQWHLNIHLLFDTIPLLPHELKSLALPMSIVTEQLLNPRWIIAGDTLILAHERPQQVSKTTVLCEGLSKSRKPWAEVDIAEGCRCDHPLIAPLPSGLQTLECPLGRFLKPLSSAPSYSQYPFFTPLDVIDYYHPWDWNVRTYFKNWISKWLHAVLVARSFIPWEVNYSNRFFDLLHLLVVLVILIFSHS